MAEIEQAYTIDLPGLTDFIRLPPAESFALKRERIQRWKTHVSPLPENLQWAPHLITQIDTARHVANVALTVAKPLIRRLPAAALGPVGWALTAVDAATVASGLLQTLLGSKGPKKQALETLQSLNAGGVARAERVASFLENTSWSGFLWNAGLAANELFGYGLQLGPLFGAISDSVFGGLAALGGEQVEIRGPPSEDPFTAAADWLTTAYEDVFGGQIMSADDHLLWFLATHLSAQLVAQRADFALIAQRAERMKSIKVPVRRPWLGDSIAALIAEGLNPFGPLRPGVPTPDADPTFLSAAQIAAGSWTRFSQEMRDIFGPTARGAIAQLIAREAGETIFEWVNGGPGIVKPVPSNFDIFIMLAIEYNVFPPRKLKPEELFNWFRETRLLTRFRGLAQPRRRELEEAADFILGGWTRRAQGTTS